MGEMTAAEVRDILRRLNPRARPEDVAIYADSYLAYQEASANIADRGNIVAHPRTGAPMENPYLKVKSGAIAEMRKCTRIIQTGALWGDDASA